MNYKKLNVYIGWLAFFVATIVYFMTIEDTVSLWDCGEYITAAYKLEVGHPPGAPLFMVLGRMMSFFSDPENVAVAINRLSALSSSMTILFMFWSLTIIIKKMVLKTRTVLSTGDKIAIFGGAFIGAMSYAFTESFWFSAVEGEVYAMASLFTALIFWAIMRWDEEMAMIKYGQLRVKGYSPDRWLLLIMFLLGLAVGVHLLGILVVPAIGYVIYYRYGKISQGFFYVYLGMWGLMTLITLLSGLGKSDSSFMGAILMFLVAGGILFAIYLLSKKHKWVEFVLVGLMSVHVLAFIQTGVIPGSVATASVFEVGFVNTFGLPFFSGTIFFFVLLVVSLVLGMRYARRKGKRILYTAIVGLAFLLVGYGSFAVIVIRSNANTPLDENDPENLVTLHSYLQREQYGSAPIASGQYWNSKTSENREDFGDLSPVHLRRFVVTKKDKDVKAFKDENRAKEYATKLGGAQVVDKYYFSNESIHKNQVAAYDQTTIFPRMYWSSEAHKVAGYKNWSGYDPTVDKGTEIGTDKNRLPTMGENLTYFYSYQINWMYWRYFMWNFSGRQNDIQGHGSAMRGNWKSGFDAVDEIRIGSQEFSPYYSDENPSNNSFFFLPLILGLIGVIFHFYKSPKDAFVIFLGFLFTGLAIVVYLNQKTFEPRERDYAYAGSFYFFAMWIGVGVYALYEAFRSFGKRELIRIAILAGVGLLFFLIIDAVSDSAMAATLSWLIIAAIATTMVGVMMVLKKVLKTDTQGAIAAIAMTAGIPLIMAVQGWDDHDRSLKTSARDLAMNYLKSCGDNGILFTNGDNDTFPLWYMQEVEGFRTDIRVCNLSLMQTDWYTDQMKMKAYESESLPIKFTEDQILMYAGNTDQVIFSSLFELFQIQADPVAIKNVIAMRERANPKQAFSALQTLSGQAGALMGGVSGGNPQTTSRLNTIKNTMAVVDTVDIVGDIYTKFKMCLEVLQASQAANSQVTAQPQTLQNLQKLIIDFEASWSYTMLDEAMAFVRNDDNLLNYEGQTLRIFPSTGFILPVNKENAIKSGVINKGQKDNCLEQIQFNFEKRGLTREQVMMLDIMANNDWKRGIYFSSPGGSDVAMALYKRGYVKQNGMAFEVSPLNAPGNRYNSEKMYKNLMEVYNFGEMQNPDVLTDYYTRRHTKQYRAHFLALAEDYLTRALDAESGSDFRGMPAADKLSVKEIADYKQKAIKLINRSLEVMPAAIVIDYGEPSDNRAPSDDYKIPGGTLKAYKDGDLHNYVTVLYSAGDVKGAERLGDIVAGQLESIMTYFEKSDVKFIRNAYNRKDFYSAINAYFILHLSAKESGNNDGKLAKRTGKFIEHLYDKIFPSMINELKDLANYNGEASTGAGAGVNARAYQSIEDYSNGIAYHFGLKEMPAPVTQPSQPTGGQPTGQPLGAPGQGGEQPSMEEIMKQIEAQQAAQPPQN
ncbi:MAG: hypothetical protein ACI865_001907 [Flavobacteriaceae bacterium]|jgi:hypothetical protein